jgi:hypothetical protein
MALIPPASHGRVVATECPETCVVEPVGIPVWFWVTTPMAGAIYYLVNCMCRILARNVTGVK